MHKSRIAYYVRRMQSRGYSVGEVLDQTGITADNLDDPWFRPGSAQYRQVIDNMLTLTGDPYLGLKLGSEFKPSDLGVLGYAALSAPDLREARSVILRYSSLNEYIVSPSNYIRDGRWYNEIAESFPLGDALSFAVEEFIARLISLSSALTGRNFPLLEVHLSYAKPGAAQIYEKFFKCPCYFRQPTSFIVLDNERLNDRTALGDDTVYELCVRQCNTLYQRFKKGKTLSERVRDILCRSAGAFPNVDEMAEKLNKSTRTFRRQLNSEGTCYHELVDQTRRDLALDYLSHTDLSPKEVSYALGYKHVSNFRRAFKSWVGVSPSQYRDRERLHVADAVTAA